MQVMDRFNAPEEFLSVSPRKPTLHGLARRYELIVTRAQYFPNAYLALSMVVGLLDRIKEIRTFRGPVLRSNLRIPSFFEMDDYMEFLDNSLFWWVRQTDLSQMSELQYYARSLDMVIVDLCPR